MTLENCEYYNAGDGNDLDIYNDGNDDDVPDHG